MQLKNSLKRVLPTSIISVLKALVKGGRSLNPYSSNAEITALYALLYELLHDKEQVPDFLYSQTKRAFGKQWNELPEGEYMLSDAWFRDNVSRIICEEELQMRPEWFYGKNILDAGCGGGRWSYGFAKLGANLTCVDINEAALERTSEALAQFDIDKRFICAPLENLSEVLAGNEFDLVWSWGVLHHCQSFNRALRNVVSLVRSGGLFYTYLYGRESIPYEEDIDLFKRRVKYNFLLNDKQKYQYLLKQVGGDPNAVHQLHDQLAPLMNRRLGESEVTEMLHFLGFSRIERVVDSKELCIRAVKGNAADIEEAFLPRKPPPYWFQHHCLK